MDTKFGRIKLWFMHFSDSGTPRRLLILGVALAILLPTAYVLQNSPYRIWIQDRIMGKYTVNDRLAQFGPAARTRWAPGFAATNLAYPPHGVLLVGFKAEKRLEVYASAVDGNLKRVRSMPILAASGKTGPKLREGDLQVPEGFYLVESLNPNSSFHVSLRVNYPSPFDKQKAQFEGRTGLGSDIMIHGSNDSVGCLAMGDEAAEDLFTLAADVGHENVRIWLCPNDLRSHPAPTRLKYHPDWLPALYADLKHALQTLP